MKTLRLMAFSLILIILLKAISVSADPIDAPSAIRDDLYASISAEVIATTNVPSINAKYAAVFDKSNRTLLYSKGGMSEHIYPASTTKILTALVVADQIPYEKWDSEMITVSAKAVNLTDNSSSLGLKQNDIISVRNALYGLMLRSGNDTAIALAEHISSSVKQFAELMNQKALSLGMTDYNFVNAHGLHDENHYTTMNDILLAAIAFSDNEHLSAIASTQAYSVELTRRNQAIKIDITNGNALLDPESNYYNRYVTGLKTGTTSDAGNCLVTHYERDGRDLLLLTYKNERSCFPDVQQLISYAESNFTLLDLADVYANKDFVVQIDNASPNDDNNGQLALRFTSFPSKTILTSISIAQRIRNGADEIRFDLPSEIKAPVFVGDPVGNASIWYNDQILYSGEMVATRTVVEETFIPPDLISISNVDQTPSVVYFLKNALPWLLGISIFIISAYILLKIRMYKRRKIQRRRSTMYGRRADPHRSFR